MSNYNDLIEFRNKLTNDTDYVIFEEDCQLLDKILDDYEQKDQRIAELEKEKQTAVKEFAEEFKKLCFNYGEFDDILCYRKNACELIDRLLKERGIE